MLKLNTEEKVDGGELSAEQRHCQDQSPRKDSELRVSTDLGKRYRPKRLQFRRVDYMSEEELVLRFLKRPDNAACKPGKTRSPPARKSTKSTFCTITSPSSAESCFSRPGHQVQFQLLFKPCSDMSNSSGTTP